SPAVAKFLQQIGQALALEGRHPAFAGNAFFLRKVAHKQVQTFGSQPFRYSRLHSLFASLSALILPVFGSRLSVWPVRHAMLPRWHQRVLLTPSSISEFGFPPLRMQSRKLAKCTPSSPRPLRAESSLPLMS